MKNIDKQGQLEELKKARKDRIEKGQPAVELDSIRKNLKWHRVLHLMISINNTYLERMKKDYYQSKKLKQDLAQYEGRPIIFAPNHVRMQDIEVQMEACPYHQVLLSGDYENVHGSTAGALLEKNGIVYFDMNDKEDRENVRIVIDYILSNGFYMLWYFEGTWCISPNNPYNDGSYQIVQKAIDTNAIVVPIAFDMIDHKTAVIRYDEPIDYVAIYGRKKLTSQEKIKALDILKGAIGRQLFEIWDDYSYIDRDTIVDNYAPETRDYPTPEEAFDFKPPHPYGVLHKYWDKYLERIISEWEFTLEELEAKRFKGNDKTSQEEVFKHLYTMKPNFNNAFLYSKRNHH